MTNRRGHDGPSWTLCNDPFSRFEQQTSILENLAEATDPTTDRRGGLVPKYLENLTFGTENQLSELCDGMAGRTVTGVTEWQDGPSQV